MDRSGLILPTLLSSIDYTRPSKYYTHQPPVIYLNESPASFVKVGPFPRFHVTNETVNSPAGEVADGLLERQSLPETSP